MSRTQRVYSQAFKVAACERMETAGNIVALARELGVQRELLYIWRAKYRAQGAAGLRARGRPGRQARPAELRPPDNPPGDPLVRIAELERRLGQAALELDFFRAALKRVGASGRSSGAPGGKASTP